MAKTTLLVGSRYKRYKLGTVKLVDWLRETAAHVARRTGEVLHTAGTLSTTDLLRLAKSISSTRPKVTVPVAMLLCVRDVIEGRTQCANFYTQLENSGTQTDETFVRLNRSHQYFISVLERIQDQLQGLQVETSTRTPSQPAKSTTKIGKKAKFDVLELEEPSAWSESTPDTGKEQDASGNYDGFSASDPPEPASRCSLEEDADMEDSFAIFCAFQDLRVIRLHLQAVWKDYHNGRISYLVAIEITKAGFVIVTDICGSLLTSCPWMDCFDDISDYLGMESSEGGFEPAYFMNNLAKVAPTAGLRDIKGDMVKPSELFCAPAYTVMHDFKLYCRAMREPANDHFRIDISSHPLSKMLRRIEPTIRFMADQVEMDGGDAGAIHGFLVDTLTESLVLTSKFGTYSIWAVVHCQILMDILDALGMEPRVGYDVLQDTVSRESDTTRVEKYSKLVEGYSAPLHASAHEAQTVQEAKDRMKNIMFNSVQAKKTLDTNLGRPEGRPPALTGAFAWPTDRDPEQLLPVLPILSGLRISLLAFSHCFQSSQQANKSVSLLGVAYAYRAAQTCGLIDGSWPDMESVIDSQSMHGSYVLEANNVEGYARHFDIAIGVSPARFTNDVGRRGKQSRPPLPNSARIAAKMKKLKPASSYMLSMKEVACASLTLDRDQFYEALYRTAQRTYNTDGRTSLTPEELLIAAQKSLLEDEIHLKFNYEGFSLKCLALLRTQCRTNAEIFAQMKKAQQCLASGVGDVKNCLAEISNLELSEAVHEALWEAVELEQKRAGRHAKINSKLGRIAHMIQGIMGLDPESFLSVARHGSSGNISDSDAPRRRWKWGGKAPVFGPITPEEHRLREMQLTRVGIQNAGCAEWRRLDSLKLSDEDRTAKVKLFVDQKLIDAGMPDMEMETCHLIPEYHVINIVLEKKGSRF